MTRRWFRRAIRSSCRTPANGSGPIIFGDASLASARLVLVLLKQFGGMEVN
jgi:hypothetical protein